MYSFAKLCVKNTSLSSKNILRQQKRFAGHAKWQNIKHIKSAKDAEKSGLIVATVRKMRVAIAEGKSHKPSENLRLAQIIEEAKKKCVPAATINGVLEKAEKTKTKSQTEFLDFRGPGGSIFAVKIMADNPVAFRMQMNTFFRKNSCVGADSKLRNIFNHRGIVITEVQKDLDAATDDAIAVEAEEVEELEDEGKFYKFYCNPVDIHKVVTKLQSLNYNVLSMDEELIPNATTTITEEDSKKIDILWKKLEQVEEIVSIYHNIESSNDPQTAESES